MPPEAAAALTSFGSSWDVIILAAFVLFGIVYGIYAGRDRAVIILISSYVSLAVVTNAPAVAMLDRAFHLSANTSLGLVWFLGLFLAVFAILWKSELLRSLGYSRGSWWETILFSVCQVGLTVSTALYLLPSQVTASLSPGFRMIFLSDEGRSLWLILPIFLLFAVGREAYDDDDDDE
ncbi:hypothetical protein M0Q28_05280 [Patescibacteria group bacterium]|jgi:hypothetical protein|nr:hypothetical protein [Patescibacteria group bacterium]